MTNQQPPSGWNPPQNTADAQHQGPPVPTAQFGSPQRPQGYPMPNVFPGSQPQRTQTESIAVGPFTLRELIIFISAFLLLVSTFLPVLSGYIGAGTNLWSVMWPLAVSGALLPIAAAALVLIRRLAPTVKLRVGSLSVDQFASVVAIVAASTYLGVVAVVLSIGASLSDVGLFSVSLSFGPLLGILFSLVLVVVTTFATVIPPFAADFLGREAAQAHITARPVKAIVRAPRPAPVPGYGPPAQQNAPNGYGQPTQVYPQAGQYKPQQAQHNTSFAPTTQGQHQGTSPFAAPEEPNDVASSQTTSEPSPISDDPHAQQSAPQVNDPNETIKENEPRSSTANASGTHGASAPTPTENPTAEAEPLSAAAHVNGSDNQSTSPFWVWSPHPRSVMDATSGVPLFEIGPDAWALAVDDRGEALVIRHDDGRVGVLNDVDGLTRG